MPEYSFDTTIGELLDTPDTLAIINDLCPALLEHPLLEVGRSYPFGLLLPYFQGLFTEEGLEALRVRLEALSGA